MFTNKEFAAFALTVAKTYKTLYVRVYQANREQADEEGSANE